MLADCESSTDDNISSEISSVRDHINSHLETNNTM